jgi:hypothetical protein
MYLMIHKGPTTQHITKCELQLFGGYYNVPFFLVLTQNHDDLHNFKERMLHISPNSMYGINNYIHNFHS